MQQTGTPDRESGAPALRLEGAVEAGRGIGSRRIGASPGPIQAGGIRVDVEPINQIGGGLNDELDVDCPGETKEKSPGACLSDTGNAMR